MLASATSMSGRGVAIRAGEGVEPPFSPSGVREGKSPAANTATTVALPGGSCADAGNRERHDRDYHIAIQHVTASLLDQHPCQ